MSNNYNTEVENHWCPGCGGYGTLQVLKQTLTNLKIKSEKLAIVYGIGCSGNMNTQIKAYIYHTIHGRTIPTAIGIKLANPKLTVIAVGGDGDMLGEGLGHLPHAARYNHDITALILNNQTYSLTTGQTSPTTPVGNKTITDPEGVTALPLDPIALSLASNASHIARTFSGNPTHLQKTLSAAITHPGFSLIEILQPCISLNKINTFAWFRERAKVLENTPQSIPEAMSLAPWTDDTINLGEFRNAPRPVYSPKKNQQPESFSTLLHQFSNSASIV
jgi:2-oxoglutarate/2-oxoacid ferredoxin oxidoreductase subunit beta